MLMFGGNRYYTTDEIAARLNRSVDMIRYYCRTGKLKARRLGKGFIISEAAVLQFLEPAEFEPEKPADE